MQSVEDEVRSALKEDPGFPPDSVDDVAERRRLIEAFEEQVGLAMPAHFRAFLVDLGFGIAPRLFSASHMTLKSAHSQAAAVSNPHHILSFYQTALEDNLDYCDTDAQRAWASRLVPVVLDNNDEYFLLDLSYNNEDPPLVSIRLEVPWDTGRARFIAPSFLEYLRYPIWDSDGLPDEPIDEPTDPATAWTAWFEGNMARPSDGP